MNKLLMVFFSAAFCISCSDVDAPFSSRHINPLSAELKLDLRSFTLDPPRMKEAFEKETEVGLYILEGSSLVASFPEEIKGAVRLKGIRSSKSGAFDWKSEVSVRLGKKPVRLYAYAPYSSTANKDFRNIPVHICPDARYTADYCYGTLSKGHRPVTCLAPVAFLSVKHAMARIVFELTADAEMSDSLDIEAVQLGSKPGGTVFGCKGTMDASTGRIVVLPTDGGGTTLLRLLRPERLSAVPFLTPGIFVFPLEKPAEADTLEVIFFVGKKRFTFTLPEGTCWKKGYEYIYRFAFTADGVRLKKIDRKSF